MASYRPIAVPPPNPFAVEATDEAPAFGLWYWLSNIQAGIEECNEVFLNFPPPVLYGLIVRMVQKAFKTHAVNGLRTDFDLFHDGALVTSDINELVEQVSINF